MLGILDIFQAQVGVWAANTFPHSTNDARREHLLDEARELRDAAGPEDIAEEAADIFLLLLHIAQANGFSLMRVAQGKFERVQRRTWGELDARGVVRHIEGGE